MTSATPDAAPKPGRPRFQALRVVHALVLREMGAKFGQSAGGYVWAIAQPLGGILLLAVVFSLALRSPPLGTSFLLFYATGMVPFNMYNTMWRAVSGSISSNRGLLNYPVVSAVDALLAKFILNFMTVLLVATILFASIILTAGIHVNFDPGAIVTAFLMASLLGLGVGAMNCVLFGFFPTWKNIWSVLTRPMFIMSGIFFTFESVPPAFQSLLWYNPLVHVIGVMRTGFYGTYKADYVSYPYVLGISMGLFLAGAWLMRRHASYLIEQ